MNRVKLLLGIWGATFVPRATLAAENLALRQQLFVFKREKPRPRIKPRD